ncbi:hypothetical protein OBBRIDRAFT_840063 [Obba rivulosa]|uniref:Uncharacterized protein n=1 Tax=Obba rivulosa TaxID=1052685 RepID=A0A8E2AGI5_9APHY|nr:hypothetical protein OBBRIDRAFT_840063 [Obba rivulosa]
MGKTKWLPKETELLEQEYASPEIQALLAKRDRGAMRLAANIMSAKYMALFGTIRAAETDAEFEFRRSLRKSRSGRANTEQMRGETEEECRNRLSEIPDRVYGWLKYQSDHRLSRSPPSLTDSSGLQARHLLSGWDIYKRERGSVTSSAEDEALPGRIQEWTAKVRAEYDALDVNAKAELDRKAAEENDRLTHSEAPSSEDTMEALRQKEAERVKNVRRFDAQVENVIEKWHTKTGFVTMCITGGVTQHGKLQAYIKCSGRDKCGRTFDEKLIEIGDLTRERLCNYFEHFMLDCFEKPTNDSTQSADTTRIAWGEVDKAVVASKSGHVEGSTMSPLVQEVSAGSESGRIGSAIASPPAPEVFAGLESRQIEGATVEGATTSPPASPEVGTTASPSSRQIGGASVEGATTSPPASPEVGATASPPAPEVSAGSGSRQIKSATASSLKVGATASPPAPEVSTGSGSGQIEGATASPPASEVEVAAPVEAAQTCTPTMTPRSTRMTRKIAVPNEAVELQVGEEVSGAQRKRRGQRTTAASASEGSEALKSSAKTSKKVRGTHTEVSLPSMLPERSQRVRKASARAMQRDP